MAYAFSRLTADDRNFTGVYDALRADNYARLGAARPWGAFHGLFGVASNELIVVTYGDVAGVDAAIAATPGVTRVDTLLLEPTVRPTADIPRTRPGLYVFRFFDVAHKDVDQIADCRSRRGRTSRTAATPTTPCRRACSGSRMSAPKAAGCCYAPGTTG